MDNVIILDEVVDANEANTLYYCGLIGYDDAGNLAADRQGYEYSYDYENRIVKIVDSNDDTVVEYTYDALGRRIEKNDHVDSSNTRRYYYSSKWQVLEDCDSSDTLKDRFLYGNYIDEVLATIVSPPTRKYYVHDHLFSPAALVNFSGTVLERYEYDAYGRPHILDRDLTDDSDTPANHNPSAPQYEPLFHCILTIVRYNPRFQSNLQD